MPPNLQNTKFHKGQIINKIYLLHFGDFMPLQQVQYIAWGQNKYLCVT